MKHKILEKITKIEKTPYGFGGKEDFRNTQWQKEREEYGFDVRETWDLSFTFVCWLYERCVMYRERASIDMEYHKVDICGKEFTQKECIDKIINNCEIIIKEEGVYSDCCVKAMEEILDIWKEVIYFMWW